MPKPIHFLVAVFSVILVGIDSPSVDAQNLRSRQPLHYGGRWLGQGWGTGYHHRDPGPNTDYYNPYTAHNSMLISQQPGYQATYNQYQNLPGNPGVPYSVYAPTSATQQQWNHGQGQSIQPTFVPADDSNSWPVDENDDDQDDQTDEDSDDMPGITSDPDEPGSIQADESSDDDTESEDTDNAESEDGDFEESDSFSDESIFDANEDVDVDENIEATKTGFSRPTTENVDSLDFNSFMVN